MSSYTSSSSGMGGGGARSEGMSLSALGRGSTGGGRLPIGGGALLSSYVV